MINPTGREVRNDSMGLGTFGASRGKRTHNGIDYVCTPGQEVLAPISGKIERKARPYADSDLSGIVMSNENMTIKMFYFKPLDIVVGHKVTAGALIGYAQDVSAYHGEGMLPHVHLEIDKINPALFIDKL